MNISETAKDLNACRFSALKSVTGFVLVLQLAGCSLAGYQHTEKTGQVELYSYEDGTVDLRLSYLETGRGNPHDLFSYTKSEYVRDEWIQLPSGEGNFRIDGQKLESCPRGKATPWAGPRLIKGTIELAASVVRIDLARPNYQGGNEIKAWFPYSYNGEWTLKRMSGAPANGRSIDCEQKMR